MNRFEIADLTYNQLYNQKLKLQKDFDKNRSAIPYFFIDDLLPEDLANGRFGVAVLISLI